MDPYHDPEPACLYYLPIEVCNTCAAHTERYSPVPGHSVIPELAVFEWEELGGSDPWYIDGANGYEAVHALRDAAEHSQLQSAAGAD